MSGVIRTTHSICPVCQKRLKAQYVRRDKEIYLEKCCPAHGEFSVIAWRDDPEFSSWCSEWPDITEDNPQCPGRCGLCDRHQNKTCCAILDVTERCNLACPYCYAASGGGDDLPMDQVYRALEDMRAQGISFLYLSGGEPTVRDDLEQIVGHAVRLGYAYIQLNTNGVRIAQDPEYAKRLCHAGVSTVFLQFDGTMDEIYRKTRGKDLLAVKCRAIEHCDAAELGVVLVPTVVPGVNDHDLGNMIRFAFSHMPAVKGMHIQPVTYVGRYQEGEKPRITLPELLDAMEAQTDALVKGAWFMPSACDSPLCGFHGEFRRKGDKLEPQFEKHNGCCCDSSAMAGVEGNQNHVKNRWTRIRRGTCAPGSMDEFLLKRNESSFCISAMAFQDEETLDLGRLSHCSVHVYAGGKLLPFCSYHVVHKVCL